ncbi:hypothetical protein FB451DRAFT_1267649 [Mycena latifolia]|nr:hypothetical protein FB451DRAFT_1267649 [Mycena latifolia]
MHGRVWSLRFRMAAVLRLLHAMSNHRTENFFVQLRCPGDICRAKGKPLEARIILRLWKVRGAERGRGIDVFRGHIYCRGC